MGPICHAAHGIQEQVVVVSFYINIVTKEGKAMIKKVSILLAVIGVFLVSSSSAQPKFPERPVNVIVYSPPGAAGDVFTKRFLHIAAKYTNAKFVVTNMPGKGGLTAMEYIVSEKADGYTLAFTTKSVVGQMAEAGAKIKIDDLDWLAMLVTDPECLIVNKTSNVRTLDQIVSDAKAKKGRQIWLGPAAGGTDHIMAIKTWKALGITATYVPAASGAAALKELEGGHGVVVVGNPDGVVGKPDMEVAVVSAPKRLSGAWSRIPTFKELGVSGLDNEIKWRGFVTKKGIPGEVGKFYHDLMTKVDKDPLWRKYIEDAGATPVFYKDDQLKEIVKEDFKESAEILKELGAAKPK